ncbi:MAG TPA: hypothetical protein VFT75_13700 [Nocardioidaceae bacterium]|jgi:hypothetical protein|nr:hypothetical protein [Nocardioidaceae bacterium]
MTTNGEPEVETDFEEIKREVADQEEADRESSVGPAEGTTEVGVETPIADVDYLPVEPGPAASVEDYDPLDVDPEDVDDK